MARARLLRKEPAEPRSTVGLSIERGGFLQQQHTNGMLKVLNVL